MSQQRLVKLLMLTNSDNDNEALSAIRQVNKMLKESNAKDWDGYFKKINKEYNDLVAQYNSLAERFNNLNAQVRNVRSFVSSFF